MDSENEIEYYKEQLDSLRGMMNMTTSYLEDIQSELSHAKKDLEEKNKEMMQSVAYAETIQLNLLPKPESNKCLVQDFIYLVKQRDKIGGDMVFSKTYDDTLLFGLMDCTGHGIPGALISMMGYSFLEQLSFESNKSNPAAILNGLNNKVRLFFEKQSNGKFMHDGMDAILCSYNKSKEQLIYSTAGRPLWVNQENWIKIKPNKISIGGPFTRNFENEVMPLKKGDELFLFSDGLPDQFGGPKDKKFLTKRILKELNDNSTLPFKEKIETLMDRVEQWQGDSTQTDDISYFAVRI